MIKCDGIIACGALRRNNPVVHVQSAHVEDLRERDILSVLLVSKLTEGFNRALWDV
jgi:hypothetical protein